MGGKDVTLHKDLTRLESESNKRNPYEEHYLLKNPFPNSGETALYVCTDQDEIRKEFISVLGNFSSEAKRLRINGTNGAGKTNILKYFELLTNEARERGHIGNIFPVYVRDPGESYFEIHRQIVEKLGALFLGPLLETLQSNTSQLENLKSVGELLIGMRALLPTGAITYIPKRERKSEIFVHWLKGGKLTAADKKELSFQGWAPSDITSASLAIRYLSDFLSVLEEFELCSGIVLLFDEFEVIFQVLPRARQSRYAQDLRHLLDTLKESVFFVIATVPNPKDLSQYPAIERRMEDTFRLHPIDSLELATDFVMEYLNRGRDEYEDALKILNVEPQMTRPTDLLPLTLEDVKAEFSSMNEEFGDSEFDVLPGYFLPRIRKRIQQIVENMS